MFGIAQDVPAYTVNKVCGSGLKAVVLGTQAIKTVMLRLSSWWYMENATKHLTS